MAAFTINYATNQELTNIIQLGSQSILGTNSLQIDGITSFNIGETIILKNQSVLSQNGIYKIKLLSSNSFELTRILNSQLNQNQRTFNIKSGQNNSNRIYCMEFNIQQSFVPGITPLQFLDITPFSNGSVSNVSISADSNAGLSLISTNFLTQFPASITQNGYLSSTSFNTFQNFRQNKLIANSPLSLNEITNTLTINSSGFQNKLIVNATLNLLETTNSLSVNTNIIQNKLTSTFPIILNEITNNITLDRTSFQNKLVVNATLNLLETTNQLSVNTNIIQNKLIAGSGITLNEITNTLSVNLSGIGAQNKLIAQLPLFLNESINTMTLQPYMTVGNYQITTNTIFIANALTTNNWKLVAQNVNPQDSMALHQMINLRNNLIVTGGTGPNTAGNEVYVSIDNGQTFKTRNRFAPYGPKEAHTSCIVGDNILVIGGLNILTSVETNDVWVSRDAGLNWTPLGNGPFQRRRHFGCSTLNNVIFIYGGESGVPYLNDVWRSNDVGVSWTQVSTGSLWSARSRFQYATVPAQNEIFVMGGSSGANLSDVWVGTNEATNWFLRGNLPSGLSGGRGEALGNTLFTLAGTISAPVNAVYVSQDRGATFSSYNAAFSTRTQLASTTLNNSIYISSGTGSSFTDVWKTDTNVSISTSIINSLVVNTFFPNNKLILTTPSGNNGTLTFSNQDFTISEGITNVVWIANNGFEFTVAKNIPIALSKIDRTRVLEIGDFIVENSLVSNTNFRRFLTDYRIPDADFPFCYQSSKNDFASISFTSSFSSTTPYYYFLGVDIPSQKVAFSNPVVSPSPAVNTLFFPSISGSYIVKN